MKKFKAGFAGIILIICAIFLFLQHQAQEKLRAENETLTQQITQLKTDNESLSNQLATANDSKSLSDDKLNELLKLRGEAGVLRRRVGELERTQDEKLSEANQKLHIAEQNLQTGLSAKAQFTAHESATINAMKRVGLAMRIYEGDHDNQYPTILNQLTNELGGSFTIGGIDIFAFELVDVGSARFDHPNMVEIRERLARQAPDGTWRRIYGFTDGSVQTATSNDGNFDAWEKQNAYSPPPNQ